MGTNNILIVEDESIIAYDIQRTLKHLGYGVSDTVSSGEEALRSADAKRPDLVLMDIKIAGGMDGIETARRLRERFHTPVIFLTAHAGEELIQRAKQTEPFGYIIKPFEERLLHTTIEIAIHNSQKEVEKERQGARRERIHRDVEAALVEIKQSEESLHKTAEALLRSNEDLEQFAATAAHDLKSPLCNIVSYAEALEEELPDLGGEGKNYLEVIRRSATRMEKLINDLLELARLSHVPKLLREIDLKVIISGVLEDLEAHVREKGASVRVGELPKVKVEPLLMRHVFQNLIENALKHGQSGEKPPVIWISGQVEGGSAEIHFRDNGAGIDEKYAEEIFLPFKRLDKRRPGIGIGLAICRKIVVEGHGGKIRVESRHNEGTDFIVELPLTAKNPDDIPQSNISIPGGRSSDPLRDSRG